MSKTRVVLAAAIAGLIALTGCSSDEPSKQSQPEKQQSAEQSNEKTEQKAEPEAGGQGDPKGVVEKAVLDASEVGNGVKVQNTDSKLGSPTNDICGKTWDSDKARVARKQDHMFKEAKVASLVVSNEAVAYEKGKGAEALNELQKAIASCNGWKHDQGEMDDVQIVEPPAGALKDSFAWAGSDNRKGTEYSYLAVYQANGDVISALYIWATDKDDLNKAAKKLVPKAAKKLSDAAAS